jgi:hypothetical protein
MTLHDNDLSRLPRAHSSLDEAVRETHRPRKLPQILESENSAARKAAEKWRQPTASPHEYDGQLYKSVAARKVDMVSRKILTGVLLSHAGKLRRTRRL